MKIHVLPRMMLIGVDTLDYLAEELRNRGARRVFVVSDRGVYKLGFVDKVVNVLRKGGLEVSVFIDVEAEPTFRNVENAAKAAETFHPDTVVAVGGGSVIDAAKGVWIKLENPSYDLRGVSPMEFIGVGKSVTFVAIPTTSGTGSDATFGIVLSEESDGKTKYALGSYEIVPQITVLDPTFPSRMPRRLSVGTALDALSHAAEALVATNASDFTDALAVKTMELIYKYLPRILDDPGDIDAREHLHIAATMGGMAFSNSGLGLAHAVAHTLGPMLKTHHGALVGSILPHVVKFNGKSGEARKKYSYVASILNASIGGDKAFLERLTGFYEAIDHPTCIAHYGASEEWLREKMEKIVEGVFSDPDLSFNPILPSEEELRNLLFGMLRCL